MTAATTPRPKSARHARPRPAPRRLVDQMAARAFERLRELLEHDDPHVALAAAREILDRAASLPKPPAPEPRIRGQRVWKGGQEALYADSVPELVEPMAPARSRVEAPVRAQEGVGPAVR